MQFAQKWWRKRPYTLCRSCRGIGDLQLCYSPLGPLLLKNLKKNAVEQGQVNFYSMPAPGVRARARRRARGHARPHRRLTGYDRRSTAATAGPKAFHRRSHPILHCHALHAHGPRETDPRRPANGVAAVPRPRARTSPSFPWSMSCHAETCLPWRV
jgi:hypothetical protein